MFDAINNLKSSINAALFGAQQPAKQDDARARLPPRPRPILTKKDILNIQRWEGIQQFDLSLVGWQRFNKEYNCEHHVELQLVKNNLIGKQTYWLGDLSITPEGQYVFHCGYNFLQGDAEALAKALLIGCQERFNRFKVVKDRYWPLALFTTNHRRQDIMANVPDVTEIIKTVPEGNQALRKIIMGDPADRLHRGPFSFSAYWLQVC